MAEESFLRTTALYTVLSRLYLARQGTPAWMFPGGMAVSLVLLAATMTSSSLVARLASWTQKSPGPPSVEER